EEVATMGVAFPLVVTLDVSLTVTLDVALGVALDVALEAAFLPRMTAGRGVVARIERTLLSCLSRAFLRLRISAVFGCASVYCVRKASSCDSTAASCAFNWLSTVPIRSYP